MRALSIFALSLFSLLAACSDDPTDPPNSGGAGQAGSGQAGAGGQAAGSGGTAGSAGQPSAGASGGGAAGTAGAGGEAGSGGSGGSAGSAQAGSAGAGGGAMVCGLACQGMFSCTGFTSLSGTLETTKDGCKGVVVGGLGDGATFLLVCDGTSTFTKPGGSSDKGTWSGGDHAFKLAPEGATYDCTVAQ